MSTSFATINLFNYLTPPNAFYQFDNIYTQAQWLKKKRWFSEKIQHINADVIAFQEVFSIEELRNQVSTIGYPYFATIDTPHIADDYIYTHPVVAIASKYPLLQVCSVESRLPNQTVPFTFNRIPLHATIELPELGAVDVYIVHFKSQRPTQWEVESPNTINRWQQETLGRWLSTVQRGYEANLLHQYVVETKQQHTRPFVIMGDFNKPLTSEEFIGLLSNTLYRQPDTQSALAAFTVHDSWNLYTQHSDLPRKPTHYAGEMGSVLDYILLSSDFNPSVHSAKAYVSHYEVIDQHLINPNFEQDHYSTDHALVNVTLKTYTQTN